MYAWLWSHLPGPLAVRILLAIVLFLLAVALLFLWVFPWLEPRLPFNHVTVDSSAGNSGGPLDGSAVRTLGV